MTSDVGDPLVEIDGLTVRRQRELLLDRVSLRIARGSLHVIVGANGAGKSTLINAVLALIPFEGRIVLTWQRRGAIGYVPQSFPIDPTLPVTVEDFLALTRQRLPVCLGIGRHTRVRIAALLARVGLSGLERRSLAVLSGGELRRVLLAHALDPEPELLILDEPASGLDEESVRWLDTVLAEMKQAQRTTILMVSHDIQRVRRLADRVTRLDRRVAADGAPDTVLTTGRDLDAILQSQEQAAR